MGWADAGADARADARADSWIKSIVLSGNIEHIHLFVSCSESGSEYESRNSSLVKTKMYEMHSSSESNTCKGIASLLRRIKPFGE